MTSRINSKVPTRSGSSSPAKPYSPSVPISLYREVATELQDNQALLESLKAHNQELIEQNQQLRVEIERVVQSALQLRQKADSFQPVNLPGVIVSQPPTVYLEKLSEKPPISKPPRASKSRSPELSHEEILFTEEPSQPINRTQAVKSEISGWWLALIILSIVVGAFGAGFLIVRPLLPSR